MRTIQLSSSLLLLLLPCRQLLAEAPWEPQATMVRPDSKRAQKASEELGAALQVDPGNTIVAERLTQLKSLETDPRRRPATAISGLPRLQPQAGKRNLNLRGDTRTAYEELAGLFGIKATLDPDINVRNVRLHVDNVDF